MMKYLEDIIGKGLEFSIILEMMGRGALNQIPYSLPLAMLLSSTMTYGKLGETVELTAMKSLGISLTKAMRPLLYFGVFLSIFAFFFSNNYLPYSNGKLKSLVADIRLSKPELLIPEGVFYDELKGYTIRLGKKYPDKTISDILIFDDSRNGQGGFIAADSGDLSLSADGNYLLLNLIDGNTYKPDKEQIKPGVNRKIPFIRNKFETNQIAFDLGGFKFERSDPNKKGKSVRNMNVNKLSQGMDSLKIEIADVSSSLEEQLIRKYYFKKDTTFSSDTVTSIAFNSDSIMAKIDSVKVIALHRAAIDQVKSAGSKIKYYASNKEGLQKIYAQHQTEWHKKFSMSIVCLIMFFIGAPFGAIVRKGGLGLPVVIGVLLFLVFHVTSTSMEKVARKGNIDPVFAMWMAPLILTPVGLFLTYKATSESDLFRFDVYKKFLKNLFSRK